jgi:hypothetical protein
MLLVFGFALVVYKEDAEFSHFSGGPKQIDGAIVFGEEL